VQQTVDKQQAEQASSQYTANIYSLIEFSKTVQVLEVCTQCTGLHFWPGLTHPCMCLARCHSGKIKTRYQI